MYPNEFSNLVFFILLVMFELSLFVAVWNNLVLKRISNLGFDALVFFLRNLINPKQAKIDRNDPKRIRELGIMLLLIAVGGGFEILSRLYDILPYLHYLDQALSFEIKREIAYYQKVDLLVKAWSTRTMLAQQFRNAVYQSIRKRVDVFSDLLVALTAAGRSFKDYYALGIEGVVLGGALRLNNMKPSEVSDFILTNLSPGGANALYWTYVLNALTSVRDFISR